MFSNFSLDKLTNTITTAAQSAQETINNTILSPDAQTKLQFKKTTRFFQEKVGTISSNEISKLPDGYQRLEEKSDSIERILKRLLVVTQTFEIEGYDYPPNLSESINSWWHEDDKSKKKEREYINDSVLSKSFATAISKAVLDSQYILVDLKDEQKEKELKNKAVASKETESESKESDDKKKESNAKTGSEEDEEDDDEDEDDELTNLISAFQSWSNCYKNIDQSKSEMDSMIVKEFNQKLSDILEIDFKTIHKLRKRVEDSRLEFDTVRHDVKVKEQEMKAKEEEKAKMNSETETNPETGATLETEQEKEKEQEKENDVKVADGKRGTEANPVKENVSEGGASSTVADGASKAADVAPSTPETADEEPSSEDDKLLEKLEDDFVSNISAAVEKMTEVTDSTELISLVKLFQNIQLVHYRQCVQEIEASMKVLAQLEEDQEEAEDDD